MEFDAATMRLDPPSSRRVNALQAFVQSGEGANLLAGYKRAANILKKKRGAGSGDDRVLRTSGQSPERSSLRLEHG